LLETPEQLCQSTRRRGHEEKKKTCLIPGAAKRGSARENVDFLTARKGKACAVEGVRRCARKKIGDFVHRGGRGQKKEGPIHDRRKKTVMIILGKRNGAEVAAQKDTRHPPRDGLDRAKGKEKSFSPTFPKKKGGSERKKKRNGRGPTGGPLPKQRRGWRWEGGNLKGRWRKKPSTEGNLDHVKVKEKKLILIPSREEKALEEEKKKILQEVRGGGPWSWRIPR